ncbi:hypothetical protein BO71DRAFT_161505 [Aspergillus ellipticus CBS 707.79]|uniref:Uncharacterized protein n=1 Tax=Aspergillus ellipticus CBS 707.79 TaxID=1448320 RepID=A0A319DH86_9EURO|nr:hypothetical protein BO71DRAFT_161505 [Aspergillus ellipticus CBS 707.79]
MHSSPCCCCCCCMAPDGVILLCPSWTYNPCPHASPRPYTALPVTQEVMHNAVNSIQRINTTHASTSPDESSTPRSPSPRAAHSILKQIRLSYNKHSNTLNQGHKCKHAAS